MLRERVSASLPPPEEGRVDNLFVQKSRQEAVVSVSGSQEGMESHGRINFGPHSSSLSPAGSSGRFESVIKGYSRTLCQIMEAAKHAPHTQTSPRSATGQVPAFHLAAQWSRLYGVWVPGAAEPSRWLLRTIWLGYAIQFTRRPPKFRGIHLTAVKAADAHVLWEESLSYWWRTWWYRSLQPIWRQGFSALTSLCPRKAVGYDQFGSAHLELGLS